MLATRMAGMDMLRNEMRMTSTARMDHTLTFLKSKIVAISIRSFVMALSPVTRPSGPPFNQAIISVHLAFTASEPAL